MKANKAYKYRLYPNQAQRVLFAKTFGSVRFIYNKMLADKIRYYQETGETLRPTPAPYKKDFTWLKEVDSLALCNAQMQLQTAHANFFRDKSIGFPKFRRKHNSRKTYTTNNIKGTVRIENGMLRLPKAGLVKIKLHRQIPKDAVIKSVTISQEPTGKYFASILTEYELEPAGDGLDIHNALGLDYSSPHFYVDSEGNTADMPHFYRQAERRLAREQRKLSKMSRGSMNYRKQKVRVARAYEKVRNCRKDWQHKESVRLASRYDVIGVEDINYKGMARSLHLAKATADNAFGQFRTFLSYKLAERGKRLITIDKWYPSSKTCRFCGGINTDLALGQTEWTCPYCGERILRDHNAAVNIRNQAIRLLS